VLIIPTNYELNEWKINESIQIESNLVLVLVG
jgi:hypothetical protein